MVFELPIPITNHICLVGDPIQDVYRYGNIVNLRFYQTSARIKPGGVLNVFSNLQAILPTKKIDYLAKIDPSKVLRLNRLIDKDSENCIIEFYAQHVPHVDMKRYYKQLMTWPELQSFPRFNLLIADYDKGTVNNSQRLVAGWNSTKIDLAIVDSRYRSFNHKIIQHAKCKIWRCTGNEYDKTWANNFDIVIHTNGPEAIQMLFKNNPNNKITIPPLNQIDAIDTCGAGDTFTAAIMAYLTNKELINQKNLVEACKFAQLCAADVVQKKLTATTTITL
jgi:hypothetical protein